VPLGTRSPWVTRGPRALKKGRTGFAGVSGCSHTFWNAKSGNDERSDRRVSRRGGTTGGGGKGQTSLCRRPLTGRGSSPRDEGRTATAREHLRRKFARTDGRKVTPDGRGGYSSRSRHERGQRDSSSTSGPAVRGRLRRAQRPADRPETRAIEVFDPGAMHQPNDLAVPRDASYTASDPTGPRQRAGVDRVSTSG